MNFSNRPHRFYCGIDLHARLLAVCVLDHAGAIVCQTQIPADKPTKSHRAANVRHVLQTCVPQVVNLVCDRLIARSAVGPDDIRAAATASLVEMGKPAAAAVTDRLLAWRVAGEQAMLVRLLARIAAKLPARDRIDVQTQLVIANGTAANDSVRGAVAEALARLRRSDQGERSATNPTRGTSATNLSGRC
jgi:hypothetical protein